LPKLLLVRHGMTEANQVKKFTGCTDIELAEEGYRQAEKLRDRLAGQQIDAAYCSDLRRAVVTAEIILSGHALEPEICPEIREIDYGVVEGLTFKEISERFPELSDMIARVSPVLSFPGGEGFHELTARAVGFIEKLKNHGLANSAHCLSRRNAADAYLPAAGYRAGALVEIPLR
jgi:alpha-ribazole phosphatase